MQHTEFEHFVRAVITNAAKNVVDMAVFGEY